MLPVKFFLERSSSHHKARTGVIETLHGPIKTPAFVTVGTKATVKGLTLDQVKDCGSQVVLANTYHLMLQPGAELIASLGGLHQFMNWSGPIITDSGGFQVFSLGAAFGKGGVSKVAKGDNDLDQDQKDVSSLATVDEDGVNFRSHLDGSLHRLTPEGSMKIQHQLGADIIMAFDECTSPLANYDYQKKALIRTHAWLERCLAYHKKVGADQRQGLFGIVQGGRFSDLRMESARFLSGLDLAGFGIGGSFVKEDLVTAVGWVTDILPVDKPRHLLGIGDPVDLWHGVEQGIDTFDCVIPTREARNGRLYTWSGKINMHNAKFQTDNGPVEEGCKCYTCKNFSKAYLSHLFRAQEMLASILASIHNLYFMNDLVSQIRLSIENDDFQNAKDDFMRKYS